MVHHEPDPPRETATFEESAVRTDAADIHLPARWQPVRLLGRGGQAAVWLAHDRRLDEWLAIKVFSEDLTPERMERLRREVTIGRSLVHPNLVRVFELIELERGAAVAMEWVQGESVAEKVARGPLAITDVIAIAGQTLDALAYVHERKVVHRDVKPSNLLLDREGRVRLADFGLAKPLEGAADVTHSRTAVGTPGYMSPEQIHGQPPTQATDLYSLGATLFHLVAGRPPYGGSSGFDVADGHLRSPVPDPRRQRPDCPAWLARFVMRLMEKAPRDRWPDATAALRSFRKRRRLLSPRRLRRGAAIAAMTAAAAAAVLAVSPSFLDREPMKVDTTTGQIVVRNGHGRELWRRSPPAPVQSWTIADFFGEGRAQVAVGLDGSHDLQTPENRPQVMIFGSRGKLRQEVDESATLRQWFPRADTRFTHAQVARADLDGDGKPELIWRLLHNTSFPGIVGVWFAATHRKPAAALVNSGHVHTATPADVDGDGLPELVVTGINNALGFQSFVAILHPRDGGPVSAGSVCSPDLLPRRMHGTASSAVPYTLLGPFRGSLSVVTAGPRGISLGGGGRTLELDAAGNPIGSPLEGKGSDERRLFWWELSRACREIEKAGTADDPTSKLLTRHPEMMAEQPTRVAVFLMVARSWARAGRIERAIKLLASVSPREEGYSDLRLRLGEYELIAGRRAAGRKTLTLSLDPLVQGRGPADARILLELDAALNGDAPVFERVLRLIPPHGPDAAEARALWGFFRGAWTSEMLAETSATGIQPAVWVCRLWAELERGKAVSEVMSRAKRLARHPQITDLANLLRAECLVRKGRAGAAVSIARAALANLQRFGRDRYEDAVWIALAHRILGEALTANHDRAAGERHLRQAARLAPNSWLAAPL